MKRTLMWVWAVSLGVALAVAGASVAQAIHEHGLEPIWSVGWIPAVLVGASGTTGRR